MNIGFTGTQKGMTQHQKEQFVLKMQELIPVEFHHGDCVGADEEAHNIIREFFPNGVIIYVHPPIAISKQANMCGDIHYAAESYLKRDKVIVDSTDCLIAAPRSNTEILRSGTWATIRYARKKNKPVFILAV